MSDPRTTAWEALLSECSDSWNLGDTYADGPRQLLEDGSVIGTIAMHISQYEEVVAAAPSAVAEVIRLREEVERLRNQLSVYYSTQQLGIDMEKRLARILNGDTDE